MMTMETFERWLDVNVGRRVRVTFETLVGEREFAGTLTRTNGGWTIGTDSFGFEMFGRVVDATPEN